MSKYWLLLAAIALAGCAAGTDHDAGPTDTGPVRACTPGETRTCACLNGMGSGAQACNSSGSGYTDCGPCMTAPRCGDGTCNSTETCSSCPADCMPCMARCGDGTCNGTETCASCAADCTGAMCMTARCGDGTCNRAPAGTETCTNCSDDCGACPPVCGDGACNGTETCASCEMDCGLCGTDCMACAGPSDCASGSFCGVRRCDGVNGCYAGSTASCTRIGGTPCPPTSAYNLCLTAAECGPYADCVRFADGRAFCARRCTTSANCPAPPPGSTTTASCNTNASPPACYLQCTAPGTCPFGLSCFRYMDGTYGYCS